jgi:hypothetical protein
MAGRWDKPGIPHKGWRCTDVVDLRANGETEGDTNYANCEMCGNERIRFVHIMVHPEIPEEFNVGCICAEKMSGDKIGPRDRETKLRNRWIRRNRWLKRKWRTSAKGNSYLNIDGNNVGVHSNARGLWSFRINSDFSRQYFDTMDEAKIALFDKLY